ncbi:MAG: DAK2 domain-containing protein, partial [Firmicutes bacterium]|nr:DAK2 domain-containing protein [Bacillota bacterium]
MSEKTQKTDKTKVEKLDKLTGALLRKMVINAAKLIDINKDHVDALNVFPVPDGDTGTNMSLTMMSCAKEVAACPSNGIEEICGAMSKGALRGARGNSGVILSQIIKGISNGIAGAKVVNIKAFAKSLVQGSDIAYKSVTKPREGTMLTIIKALADSASIHSKKSMEFPEFLEKIIEDGEEMLKRTPDMLPILKKAGVVDAGGRGVLILFKGFLNILRGIEDVNLSFDDTVSAEFDEKFSEGAHFDFSDLAEIEFAYCTEFQIINIKKKTTEANIDRLREHLETIGDSVLVIGDIQFVKVHVHTNEPGVALTYALELGEVDKIKIDNMLEQNRDLVGKRKEDLKPFG